MTLPISKERGITANSIRYWLSKKIKKLYAPKAKPVYREKTPTKPRADGFVFEMMPTISYTAKLEYEPHTGELKDYLTVYMEYHDAVHRRESFMNRMNEYYKRLRELGI